MLTKPVKSLSEFVEAVRRLRKSWRVAEARELWFRGESEKHATPLRPKLLRLREDIGVHPRNPVAQLLSLENKLYDIFRRLPAQLASRRQEESLNTPGAALVHQRLTSCQTSGTRPIREACTHEIRRFVALLGRLYKQNPLSRRMGGERRLAQSFFAIDSTGPGQCRT